MARKPRLEFENAIYHVIERGNYRKDLFAEDGSAKSFQSALFEACAFLRLWSFQTPPLACAGMPSIWRFPRSRIFLRARACSSAIAGAGLWLLKSIAKSSSEFTQSAVSLLAGRAVTFKKCGKSSGDAS